MRLTWCSVFPSLKLGEAVRQRAATRQLPSGAAALGPGAPRMCEPCMSDALLLEAVRRLRVAEPDLGFKPLLAKLQAQQPDLGAATKEVREALIALKAESEAAKAATAQPAANEGVPPGAADEGNAPPVADEGPAWVPGGRLPLLTSFALARDD